MGQPFVLYSFRLYLDGVSADGKWFLLELNEALLNGTVCVSFSMTVMDKYFRCIYTPKNIYAICMAHFSQRNVSESGFASQIGQDGRDMLHSILFHTIKMAGKLLDSPLTYDTERGFERARLALQNTRGERDNIFNTERENFISYQTHCNYERFF